MLVITRKVGESIVIDGNIVVSVVASSRGQVKLSFNAPPDVKIVRSELLEEEKSTEQ